MERQATKPARFVARIVMVLVPTSRGIAEIAQLLVPVAVPDVPVELAHVTVATPAMSRAVPVTDIEEAAVERVVKDGETMAMLGGAVSFPMPAEYETCRVRDAVAPFCA